LKDAFRECGNVIRADILQGIDGRSKGQGIVIYETREAALKAIGPSLSLSHSLLYILIHSHSVSFFSIFHLFFSKFNRVYLFMILRSEHFNNKEFHGRIITVREDRYV
jgi:RNA recognition motif-containing protein